MKTPRNGKIHSSYTSMEVMKEYSQMNLQTKKLKALISKNRELLADSRLKGFFWFFCCFSGFNFISELFTSSAQTKGLTCYLGVVLC